MALPTAQHATAMFDSPCIMGNPKSDLLKFLYVHGPTSVGVFRTTASVKVVLLVRAKLDAGGVYDASENSISVATGTLKEYLRTLPDSLLLCDLYDNWLRVITIIDMEERKHNVKRLVGILPRGHELLLRHLVRVLHRITEHSVVNNMTSSNLATCIGPSLLWSNKTGGDSSDMATQMNDVELIRQLVILLIDDAVDIFGDLEFVHLFDNVGNHKAEVLDDHPAPENVPASRNVKEPFIERDTTSEFSLVSRALVQEELKGESLLVSDSDSFHSMLEGNSRTQSHSSLDSYESDNISADNHPFRSNDIFSQTIISRDSGLSNSNPCLFDSESITSSDHSIEQQSLPAFTSSDPSVNRSHFTEFTGDLSTPDEIRKGLKNNKLSKLLRRNRLQKLSNISESGQSVWDEVAKLDDDNREGNDLIVIRDKSGQTERNDVGGVSESVSECRNSTNSSIEETMIDSDEIMSSSDEESFATSIPPSKDLQNAPSNVSKDMMFNSGTNDTNDDKVMSVDVGPSEDNNVHLRDENDTPLSLELIANEIQEFGIIPHSSDELIPTSVLSLIKPVENAPLIPSSHTKQQELVTQTLQQNLNDNDMNTAEVISMSESVKLNTEKDNINLAESTKKIELPDDITASAILEIQNDSNSRSNPETNYITVTNTEVSSSETSIEVLDYSKTINQLTTQEGLSRRHSLMGINNMPKTCVSESEELIEDTRIQEDLNAKMLEHIKADDTKMSDDLKADDTKMKDNIKYNDTMMLEDTNGDTTKILKDIETDDTKILEATKMQEEEKDNKTNMLEDIKAENTKILKDFNCNDTKMLDDIKSDDTKMLKVFKSEDSNILEDTKMLDDCGTDDTEKLKVFKFADTKILDNTKMLEDFNGADTMILEVRRPDDKKILEDAKILDVMKADDTKMLEDIMVDDRKMLEDIMVDDIKVLEDLKADDTKIQENLNTNMLKDRNANNCVSELKDSNDQLLQSSPSVSERLNCLASPESIVEESSQGPSACRPDLVNDNDLGTSYGKKGITYDMKSVTSKSSEEEMLSLRQEFEDCEKSSCPITKSLLLSEIMLDQQSTFDDVRRPLNNSSEEIDLKKVNSLPYLVDDVENSKLTEINAPPDDHKLINEAASVDGDNKDCMRLIKQEITIAGDKDCNRGTIFDAKFFSQNYDNLVLRSARQTKDMKEEMPAIALTTSNEFENEKRGVVIEKELANLGLLKSDNLLDGNESVQFSLKPRRHSLSDVDSTGLTHIDIASQSSPKRHSFSDDNVLIHPTQILTGMDIINLSSSDISRDADTNDVSDHDGHRPSKKRVHFHEMAESISEKEMHMEMWHDVFEKSNYHQENQAMENHSQKLMPITYPIHPTVNVPRTQQHEHTNCLQVAEEYDSGSFQNQSLRENDNFVSDRAIPSEISSRRVFLSDLFSSSIRTSENRNELDNYDPGVYAEDLEEKDFQRPSSEVLSFADFIKTKRLVGVKNSSAKFEYNEPNREGLSWTNDSYRFKSKHRPFNVRNLIDTSNEREGITPQDSYSRMQRFKLEREFDNATNLSRLTSDPARFRTEMDQPEILNNYRRFYLTERVGCEQIQNRQQINDSLQSYDGYDSTRGIRDLDRLDRLAVMTRKYPNNTHHHQYHNTYIDYPRTHTDPTPRPFQKPFSTSINPSGASRESKICHKSSESRFQVNPEASLLRRDAVRDQRLISSASNCFEPRQVARPITSGDNRARPLDVGRHLRTIKTLDGIDSEFKNRIPLNTFRSDIKGVTIVNITPSGAYIY